MLGSDPVSKRALLGKTMATNQITQKELIAVARTQGMILNPRTLRFWTARGLLPRPIITSIDGRQGTRAYYPPDVLDRIRYLYSGRGRRLPREIKNHLPPGITSAEIGEVLSIKDLDGKMTVYLRLKDGSIVIHKRRRT